MKHVSVRQIGSSIFMRIPIDMVRAFNLKNHDLAFLTPIEGRPDKFEVTLVKLPVPPEWRAAKEAAEEAVS
jgi:hypothetical protein